MAFIGTNLSDTATQKKREKNSIGKKRQNKWLRDQMGSVFLGFYSYIMKACEIVSKSPQQRAAVGGRTFIPTVWLFQSASVATEIFSHPTAWPAVFETLKRENALSSRKGNV